MSQEMKHNKTKITVVSFEEYQDIEFIDPALYFVKLASGWCQTFFGGENNYE